MILDYLGGVILPQRTEAAHFTGAMSGTDAVACYYELESGCTLSLPERSEVRPGTKLAILSDGTPIYSSVGGMFDGIYEQNGVRYARVSATEGETETELAREPESHALSELDTSYLLEATRTLGVFDVFSGSWLWRRASRYAGKTRRIVVDVTDDNGWSFTSYRASLRAPGAILGGAKILLQMMGATKIVFVTDRSRKKATSVFLTMINDPTLTVLAEANVKYPLREETLYPALYGERPEHGVHAADKGVFIVRAQTCEAVYNAFLTGKPQLSRWLSIAGDGFGMPGVYEIPFGTTMRRILEFAQFKGGSYRVSADSPLGNTAAYGVLGGKTESLLASVPLQKHATRCIACGRCSEVCPMRLDPHRILYERKYLYVKALSNACIRCGCCEYICPSGLPLRELIAANGEQEHSVGK